MDINKKESLEKRALKLLKWKVIRNSESPNPFTDTTKIIEELDFLIDKEYVTRFGNTLISAKYIVTPEGKKYALSH